MLKNNHTTNVVSMDIGSTMQKYQNYFFFIPATATVLAIVAILVFGLKPGIDLKGGSLLQVTYPDGRPALTEVQTKVDALKFGEIRIQPSNENDFILRHDPIYSTPSILGFSRLIKRHPGIVAGQLQHKIKRPELFKKLQSRVREFLTATALTDGYGKELPSQI